MSNISCGEKEAEYAVPAHAERYPVVDALGGYNDRSALNDETIQTTSIFG